jgi:hypothetical protein
MTEGEKMGKRGKIGRWEDGKMGKRRKMGS